MWQKKGTAVQLFFLMFALRYSAKDKKSEKRSRVVGGSQLPFRDARLTSEAEKNLRKIEEFMSSPQFSSPKFISAVLISKVLI